MFTIKHVTSRGNEAIFAAANVSFTEEVGSYVCSQLPGRNYTPATVWYGDAGKLEPLTGGVVYVMNSAGATVAKYDLAPNLGVGVVGEAVDPDPHNNLRAA